MRARIQDMLGLTDLYDIPGMTELYGHGTGLECRQHEGIHYWADYYILELLDPATLEPVAPGEIGEMVVTTLCKEAAPLIRYRTRDLTRLIEAPCGCGSMLPRHDRILGRSDDMLIYRAVNIYPGQIDEVLSGIQDANCEYQVHLARRDDGKDYMTIRLECCDGFDPSQKPGLARQVVEQVKKQIMVTCDVEIVDYCSLPRSERKSKRFFDHRDI
jgi:phenylacetate-CoA ligase